MPNREVQIMLLLYAVIFLVILLFLLAWFFLRRISFRPRTRDITVEEQLMTSEWFSYMPVLKPALEWFAKQPWEEIAVTSKDGTVLRGLWQSGRTNRPCAVLMHGYGGLPQDLCTIARLLSRQGWAMLLPFERAHGKSGGDYCSLGILEAEDCAQWAREAVEKCPEGTKLILYGCGMGAFSVLHALSKELPPETAAIVSEGTYVSPKEILRHVMKVQMRMRVFPLLQILCLYGRIIWGNWPGLIDLKTELQNNFKIPVFFLHGMQDRRVPSSMSEELKKICASPSELYISKEAGHGACFLADGDACFERLMRFFSSPDSFGNSSQTP